MLPAQHCARSYWPDKAQFIDCFAGGQPHSFTLAREKRMSDYVMAKVMVQGDAGALSDLRKTHLADHLIDFNTVSPVPVELMIEQSSAPETGYDALYGDWTSPAKAWTWKEAAQKLGYPFPLESREQVIACIRSSANPGFYFDGADQYKRNHDKYGHCTWYGWCPQHWGTKTNAEEVSVNDIGDAIEMRFATAWAFPAPVFTTLSKAFPQLEFEVLTMDEVTEEPERYILQNGIRTRDIPVTKRQARKEFRG